MSRRPLAVLLATLAASAALTGCGSDDEPSSEGGTGSSGTSCDYVEDGTGGSVDGIELPPSEAEVSGEVPVTIATSAGDLAGTLDADAAPCTVGSFVSLAEQGFYDGTPCHRLTVAPASIQVLQCGDPTGTGTGGPGYTIPDETEGDETYPPGTLAMANTGAPDSGGSQFFIVYGETSLPPSYTVFGTLDDAAVQTVADVAANGVEDGAPDGAPAQPVGIESVDVS